jgi:hypothetical protein
MGADDISQMIEDIEVETAPFVTTSPNSARSPRIWFT